MKLVSFTFKNVHATRCGNGIGGEFEKAFSKARTGNLLIVSPFVTKRATVFKYSMNGAESIGGKKFFHGESGFQPTETFTE